MKTATHPRMQNTTPAYNSTRGGKNFNSSHVLGENIRPWTGIKVRTFDEIPNLCICTWTPRDGKIELKFRSALCREHA